MGYMALLRNLRGFDQVGVSDDVAATVAGRLADPEQVRRSRQFPFRFLAAYRATSSLRWSQSLERARQQALAIENQLATRKPGRSAVRQASNSRPASSGDSQVDSIRRFSGRGKQDKIRRQIASRPYR